MLHPGDSLAVKGLLNSDMRHGRGRRRAMPVLLARLEPDHISWTDLLDRAAFALDETVAGRDDEHLPKWMNVPRRARAGLKRYGVAGGTRRCLRREQGVDPHRAGEPLG